MRLESWKCSAESCGEIHILFHTAMPTMKCRVYWPALLVLVLLTAVNASYSSLCRSLKRFASVSFNSLAISSCLMSSVYIPDASATQGSKLESLYHISKPLPFKDSSERYNDLISSNDKDAIYNMNRYLIDYTFGTITTVRI